MKKCIIYFWKIFQWIFIFYSKKGKKIVKYKPFFSGAVSGNYGGPL